MRSLARPRALLAPLQYRVLCRRHRRDSLQAPVHRHPPPRMECRQFCENVWPTNCMHDNVLLISPRLPWKTSAGCKLRLRRPMRFAMTETSPLPSVSCVKLYNAECSTTPPACVLRDRPSHCQPTTSTALHVPRPGSPPMACSKKLLAAKHDKTRPATKCHGTMQSHIIEPLRVEPEPIRTEPNLTHRIRSARRGPPSGAGGRLPAKAEWLERRKGWPLQWRRLSFPGSLLPTRPDPTRHHMTRHDTN